MTPNCVLQLMSVTSVMSLPCLCPQVIAQGFICGKRCYLKSGWNIMDGFLVAISLIDITISLSASSSPRIFGILRVFRLLRTLRPLRSVPRPLKSVPRPLRSVPRPLRSVCHAPSGQYPAPSGKYPTPLRSVPRPLRSVPRTLRSIPHAPVL